MSEVCLISVGHSAPAQPTSNKILNSRFICTGIYIVMMVAFLSLTWMIGQTLLCKLSLSTSYIAHMRTSGQNLIVKDSHNQFRIHTKKNVIVTIENQKVCYLCMEYRGIILLLPSLFI